MNLADLAGDVLIVLPEFLRIALMLVIPVLVAAGLIIGCDLLSVAPRRIRLWFLERRAERVLVRQRRDAGERARQDVAEQARSRDFSAWDADADMGKLLAFERQTDAEIIEVDFPRQVGGWSK